MALNLTVHKDEDNDGLAQNWIAHALVAQKGSRKVGRIVIDTGVLGPDVEAPESEPRYSLYWA